MLNTPEAALELHEQDAKKLELATVRLSTVQREVLAATKELASLDEQVLNARKSKSYLDEQVLEATAHLDSLQQQRQNLTIAVRDGERELSSHTEEHGKMRDTHNSRERDLDVRTNIVLKAEKDASDMALALSIKEKKIEADRAEVDNARNTFLDAIASVTWR